MIYEYALIVKLSCVCAMLISVKRSLKPTQKVENELRAQGYVVVGVDEVGAGCLAGPVVAVALELPDRCTIAGIADSKLVSEKKRREIFEKILRKNIKWAVGMATAEEIDSLNIRRASKLAMKRAVQSFGTATYALIDAWKIPDLGIPHHGIYKGDRLIKSIAAASIVAKVVRDFMMTEYEQEFPGFGLAHHKGYGTKEHYKALNALGATRIHRKTFLKKLFSQTDADLQSELF